MKPCDAFAKISVLICISSICSMTVCVGAAERPSELEDSYLPVRESLLPMFNPTFRVSNEYFPVNRIDPNVRPYIHFYLDNDDASDEYVSGGIWLLGVVGTTDDIKFIDNYLQLRLARLDGSRQSGSQVHIVAGASGCFGGMMLKRRIQGAEEFLRKYTSSSAWLSLEAADSVDAYNYFILGAYQYSHAGFILPLLRQASSGPRPFLRESALEALETSETDEYTRMMRTSPKSKEVLEQYRTEFLTESGRPIDILLNKQTLAQWREVHEDENTAVEAEGVSVESFESIDMTETIEGERMRDISNEATAAFQALSNVFLDTNAETPPIQKSLLQDIHETVRNGYGPFRVAVEIEARINELAPTSDSNTGNGAAAMPGVLRDREAATVEFDIQGTAELIERHVSETGGDTAMTSANGDVMIRMERSGRDWCWGNRAGPSVETAAEIVDDEYLITCVRDAMAVYGQIAGSLIDGSYDLLTIPLLDNGELIPLEKRRRDTEEMAQALEVEKKILGDLVAVGSEAYHGYRVSVKFDATIGDSGTSMESAALASSVSGYESSEVVFSIRNAATTYRKYAPERSGQESLDDAGNLRVSMKRINGKWYWTPFGW